jgi:riboflavin-specific deaminase-like protein
MHLRPLLPADAPAERALEDWYDAPPEPLLRAGFVLSTDGGIAADGSSLPLSGPADKAVFHALRATSDAVVVGAGTVRREDYGPVLLRRSGRAWRAAHGREGLPPLVVVSGRLDLDPAARVFTGDVRTIVVTCAAAPPAARARLEQVADVLVAGDATVDVADAVEQLRARGLQRLLCEGGPTLLTDLLRAGLVDELCLTSTPVLLGDAPRLTGPLPRRLPLELVHLLDADDGVLFARYRVRRGGSG